MALVWRVWGDTKGSIFIRSLVTFVWSSGDAEKAMAPHSSTLAWKIPWLEEPGRLQSKGSLRLDTTEQLHFHFSLSCIGAGNGNPLQCCCLENSRDRGASWASIYGVAQSWTRLKRLSSSSSSSRRDVWERMVDASNKGKIVWETYSPSTDSQSWGDA